MTFQGEQTVAELRARIRVVQTNLDAAVAKQADLSGRLNATTRPGERARLGGEVRRAGMEVDELRTELGGLTARLRVMEAPVTPVAPAPTPTPRAAPIVQGPVVPAPPPPAVPFAGVPVNPVAPQGLDQNGLLLGGLLTAFVLAPLAFAIAWRLVRRGDVKVNPADFAESTERLRRIEQAVDAIAIEVERISENQRFLTSALASEKPPAELAGPRK
jgi:hypothetical protein